MKLVIPKHIIPKNRMLRMLQEEFLLKYINVDEIIASPNFVKETIPSDQTDRNEFCHI